MSRALRAAAAAACALALSGCYTIRYERRGAPEAGAPREQWHHGLVGGAVDASGPIALDKVCPEDFAAVENQVTFFNWLGQLLTGAGGLWVLNAHLWDPSTVRVTCAQPAGAARTLTLVLLPLAPLGEVDKATVALFTEALAGELRRRPGVSVLADSDVAALLGAEKRRQVVAGCTDAGCLAELGGALGADRVVHGTVGRVGGSLLVNIASLDARRARGAAAVSERLKGAGDEAFLDALPAMVDRLLAEPAPARKPPRPTDGPARPAAPPAARPPAE
ncbi:MAG: hypothetical protein IPO09_01530 [Anaeromyxobacter sp.]|nr:hypothetical protein [Anaeromyxobacter sp.]MBL0278159.1 hypothetical protein [Anaeromyxobacter sp.]